MSTTVVARLLLTTLTVVCSAGSQQSPSRIPIGALLDIGNGAADTTRLAFRYQIERHNNRTTASFKLEQYESYVDVTNEFQLIKAECSTAAHGIFALLGVADDSSVSAILSFANTFHIPVVTPTAAPPITDASSVISRHHGNQPHQSRIHAPTSSTSSAAASSSGQPTNRQWHYHAATTGYGHTSVSNHTDGFAVFLKPAYHRAVAELIRHFRWTQMYYLYNSDEALRRLGKLYEEINSMKLVVNAVRVTNVEQCYLTLRFIDAKYPENVDRHIALDFSTTDDLQSVLQQVVRLGMHRTQYHYILVGMEMSAIDLANFRYGGVNITGFRLVDEGDSVVSSVHRDWSKHYPQLQATNTDKLTLKNALMMDAVETMIRGLTSVLTHNPNVLRHVFRRGHVYYDDTRGIPCRREPMTSWIHGYTILNHLRRVTFDGLTGPVSFDPVTGHRSKFRLDVLAVSFDSEVRKVGTWNDTHGLRMEAETPQSSRRSHSQNRTYIVTTLREPPYLILRTKVSEDGQPLVGNNRYDGYCAELAKKIAGIVRYDYILREVQDGKFGAEEKGGWNGMVGELIRGEADIAIAPLTISHLREKVIDFSKPFMQLGISIMIKKPEKQKPGVFSFMDPLSYYIWLCIVISYLGVAFVLFIVAKFSPAEWQVSEGPDGPTVETDFTLRNSLWFALGAFMQQGCGISPRSVAGRLAACSWWFFTLILISTYTANLAAFLTVERMLTPIESADDLIKQTEIKYGTLQSGSSKSFFQNSKIYVYSQMWKAMHADQSVFVPSTESGVSRVRDSKGKYAFLLESTMNDYYNQKKPCNTMKVGENLDSKGYGVATRIGLPLRTEIGLAVLRLVENGELQKLHKKWWYDKGECPPEGDGKGGSSQSALTLTNVAGIFYILIAGLGLSMLVSLIEFISQSFLDARRQKVSLCQYVHARMALPNNASPAISFAPTEEVNNGTMASRATAELEIDAKPILAGQLTLQRTVSVV